jgi:tetraacyldisaccharide 4'-kinase
MAEAAWARRTVWGRAASLALVPASWSFGGVVRLRNQLYDSGHLRAERVPARVVSVGNLTVGGSGKTPLVLWLAERLAASGRRVGIVARGYRKERAGVVVVGRNGTPLVSVREGGDEAVLLARRFAGPVVVGEDRVAAARVAAGECNAELLVLDDGFQHRRLARDLDVVIVHGDPRQARLLPAGPLREGARALCRAGVVVTTAGSGEAARSFVPPGVPVVTAAARATALVTVREGRWETSPLDALAGREVAAVAGIARPNRFLELLAQLGARVRETRLLDDHHAYVPGDLEWIAAAARRHPVLTTEKDLVKLAESPAAPPVSAVRLDVDVTPADTLLRLAAGADVVCGGARPGEEVTA